MARPSAGAISFRAEARRVAGHFLRDGLAANRRARGRGGSACAAAAAAYRARRPADADDYYDYYAAAAHVSTVNQNPLSRPRRDGDRTTAGRRVAAARVLRDKNPGRTQRYGRRRVGLAADGWAR